MVCGAFLSTLLSRAIRPSWSARISPRIAIMAMAKSMTRPLPRIPWFDHERFRGRESSSSRRESFRSPLSLFAMWSTEMRRRPPSGGAYRECTREPPIHSCLWTGGLILFEPRSGVVRIPGCRLGRSGWALVAHQHDLHPGDGEDRRRPEWRRRDQADLRRLVRPLRMTRQERGQVRLRTDRARTRSASSLSGMQKGLVQVQMADVGAVVTRSAPSRPER